MEAALREAERRAAELQAAQVAAAQRAMSLEAEQRTKDLEHQRLHADQKALFEEAVAARLAEEERKFQVQLAEARVSHRAPSPEGEEHGGATEEQPEEAPEDFGDQYERQWFPQDCDTFFQDLGLTAAQSQGVQNWFAYASGGFRAEPALGFRCM